MEYPDEPASLGMRRQAVYHMWRAKGRKPPKCFPAANFDIVDEVERMMKMRSHDQSFSQEKALKIEGRLRYTDTLKKLIGQEVRVFIDRPIGFDHDGIKYELNYGYIKDFKAPDGEYQDAYVLGVDVPIESFAGKVVAVINRKNDIEDKLVVCDKSKIYTQEEIKKAVGFQEKYFNTEVLMF